MEKSGLAQPNTQGKIKLLLQLHAFLVFVVRNNLALSQALDQADYHPTWVVLSLYDSAIMLGLTPGNNWETRCCH